VIRLSPDLKVLDWFAPSNWAVRNALDADLGSTGPALLGHGLVFQIGKQGTGFLLHADYLGQIGGQAYSVPICSAVWRYHVRAAAPLRALQQWPGRAACR
jgi:hypothetical protein